MFVFVFLTGCLVVRVRKERRNYSGGFNFQNRFLKKWDLREVIKLEDSR